MHSTEEAFLFPTQQPWTPFPNSAKIFSRYRSVCEQYWVWPHLKPSNVFFANSEAMTSRDKYCKKLFWIHYFISFGVTPSFFIYMNFWYHFGTNTAIALQQSWLQLMFWWASNHSMTHTTDKHSCWPLLQWRNWWRYQLVRSITATNYLSAVLDLFLSKHSNT